MSTLDEKLKGLMHQKDIVSEELTEVKLSIRETELAIAKRDHGVEVGVTVRDQESDEFLVTRVLPKKYGKPWLRGYKRLKGGDFSTKRELHIYNEWELVEGVG